MNLDKYIILFISIQFSIVKTLDFDEAFELSLSQSQINLSNSLEKFFRQQIFKRNYYKVNQFNTKNKSYKLGFNKFSVMSLNERNNILANNRQKLRQQYDSDYNQNNDQQALISNAPSPEQFQQFWGYHMTVLLEGSGNNIFIAYVSLVDICGTKSQEEEVAICIKQKKQSFQTMIKDFKINVEFLKQNMTNDYIQLKDNLPTLVFYYQPLLQALQEQYQYILTTATDSLQSFDYHSWGSFYPEKSKEKIPVRSLFQKMIKLNKKMKDWKTEGKVTPVKDQKDCASGWVFSAIGVIESQKLIDQSQVINLSEQQPLNCTFEILDPEYNSCKGGLGFMAIENLINNGAQQESDLPYLGIDDVCTQPADDDILQNITSFNYLDSVNDMQKFLEALYERPLAVALHVNDMFMNYESGNIDCIDRKIYDQNSFNNHEVLATGYFIDEDDPQNSYIEFKNSWGTSFGDNGYFKLKLYNQIKVGDKEFLIRQNYLKKGPCGLLENSKDIYYVNLN